MNTPGRRSPLDFWPQAQAQTAPVPPAAVDVLRYGGDAGFAPFESLDAQGRPGGFQVEMLSVLAKRIARPIDIRLRSWAQTEAAFRNGEIDVLAMVPTPARRSWALFCRGHASPVLAAYHQQGQPDPQGPQALAGQRLVVLAGEAMRETLATTFSHLPEPVLTVSDATDALRAVADGRADVAVLLRAYADPVLAAGRAPGVVASTLNLLLQTYALAVLPGRQDLLNLLQVGLDAMEADGTLEALRTAWLPSHSALADAHRMETGLTIGRYQTLGMAGLAAAALGALGWTLQRRNLAAQRERRRRMQAEGALRRAEELLGRSFTQHPEAMLVIERGTGIVRDANQAAHRLLGVAHAALIGRPLGLLEQHLPAGALPPLTAMLDQNGEISGLPLQLNLADGSRRDCLLSADEMQVGEVLQVFCLLRDISEDLKLDAEMQQGYDHLLGELRSAKDALDAARDARVRAEQRLEDFTQAVTHDLQSPLRALQGFVGLLRERLLAGHTRESLAYSDHIGRAGQRMNAMVSSLSRLAQVTRQPLQRQPIEMTTLAQGTWSMLGIAHRDWQAQCEVATLPVAQADSELVAQVWQNLMENAGKFTVGVAQPRVRVDSHHNERGTWYRVTDNGVGFDMSRAAGLFQPFQRMHAGPRFEGSGVGLSVVRRIVELHGGEVRVRSAPGVGTVAEFTLDAMPGSAAEGGR